MDKLDMQSKNLVDENISKIAELFPNCITEGKNEEGQVVKLVDFDLLKQELSKEIVEGNDERYTLNWAGKKQAILTANSPINATLRPCREESVDFDNTKNIYIEGDNLDVLKLLRETYLNKIKIIYIDPPYNTGNDFVYEDDFASSTEDYLMASKSYDDQGNKMFQNNDSNGRFHSDWLSMMLSRLKLSKDLLESDGVIFISIGENEQSNLKKLCDEIFGMQNFITCCTRIAKRTSNKGNYFKPTKDYVLVYAKDLSCIDWKFGVYKAVDEKDFTFQDEKGKYKKNGASLYQPSLDSRPNQRYYIECPDGSFIIPPGTVFPSEVKDGAMVKPLSNKDKCWRWSYPTYLANKDKLIFTPASSTCPLIDSNGNPSKWNIYDKVYFDAKDGETLLPEDVIYDYVNSQGTKELIDLEIPFTFAKPSGLIKHLINICRYKNDITILDFFSGSASTADAVMQLNAEDNGNRKFIMVQIPELCDETSDAYQQGYKNICEIGKDRIRKAGNKIKSANQLTAPNLDIGFRVLKLDSSCMKDVYYSPNKISQDLLSQFEDNIKEDRTAEDLLFQVMLDMGVILSSEIKILDIKGKKVFNVNDGNLVCCFDKNLTDEVVTEIAKMQPLYAVFRDASMSSDSVAVNFDQIFETYSTTTTRKII